MVSSFTLISLIGVMLGVLVLVVVMAVYAGLEREVKSRFLGFSPHVQLSHLPVYFAETPALHDWQDIAARMKSLPHVQSATGYVADNVIIDVEDWQNPFTFLGVDAEDPAQVEGIAKMLDMKNHPDSSADFGIDDRVVVSSRVADSFMIGVGDSIRLYSTRNLKEVMRVYKANAKELLRDAHPEAWSGTSKLAESWKKTGETATITITELTEIHDPLFSVLDEKHLRQPERDLLETLLVGLESGEKDEAAGTYAFDAETLATIETAIDELNHTNKDKLDADTYKDLEKFVLPKDVQVIGVYQASMMAVTPDVFVPLPLAQGLAGLEDGAVQSISLRLDDAYAASTVAAGIRKTLGPDWSVLSWNEQPQFVNFSMLISQQRVMMYFSLSFIMLVAAFSMMANIFTVTIQKRREIGVMKALGAAPGQIVRVFIYQGMLLGLLGGGLGIGIGRVVIHFRGPIQQIFRSFGFDPFSAQMVGFDVIPAHNNPVEHALIGVMAFVLCTLAALVPAFFAARSDAAKSLRNL
jgi:lipoprotein-releasing system permease protein